MRRAPSMIQNTSAPPPQNRTRDEAARGIRDARMKLAAQSVDPISFRQEMLEMYARNQLAVAFALPMFAVVLGATAMIWIRIELLLFWLAGIFICQGVLLGLCDRYARAADEGMAPMQWGRRFTAIELAGGFAWASLVFLGWAEGNTTSHVYLFAITIIMIAIRVTLSSQILLIVYAGTVPITFAVATRMVIEGDTLHVALAGVLVTAELYFVWLSRRLNQTAQQMIAFRAEKDALIAELAEAQAKSDEARRRAEEANLAKSRFLATMSHELRTPLNAILGFSEVMKKELMGPHSVQAYREYAEDIHSSGGHLLNLINEILDLSRIEAGRYELRESEIDVIAIGRECHKLMQIRARERNLTILEDFAKDLPGLWADERAVRQIWLNLLSNAIKFTPPGGRVMLKARRAAAGIAFSVRDTGPGIAAEEIPRILSSFGQGAIARRHAEEGAGLGLPIVKGLAELHGGTLKIVSKLRQGTEMIVEMPMSRVISAGPGDGAAAEDLRPTGTD
jgi:two-component system cell cycle sensor histidine kinase PleC